MIVILEGPDGAGKSTLAKQLHDKLQETGDVRIIHHGPYKNASPVELAKLYFASMTSALTYDSHVILDRSWYSEPIYAKTARAAPSRISEVHSRMLERTALARGGVVINCLPSLDACIESFDTRPEYLKSIEQLRNVYYAYSAWGDAFNGMPMITYDHEQMTFESLYAKLCVEELRKVRIPYLGGGAFKTGNVLVLCSKWRVSRVRQNAVVVPYVHFTDASNAVSDNVTQLFIDQNIAEKDIYWVNVETTSGVELNPNIVNALQPRAILAIGAQPRLWAAAHDVKAVNIAQPTERQPLSVMVQK